MKVILLKDVPGTGKRNAVVTVADGYAKNYLIPRGQAVAYTEGASHVLEGHLQRIAEEERAELAQANALKAKIEELALVFKVKTRDGKAFGKTPHKEVVEALEKLNIPVSNTMFADKSNLDLGAHSLAMRLHKDVTATLQVEVRGEEQ